MRSSGPVARRSSWAGQRADFTYRDDGGTNDIDYDATDQLTKVGYFYNVYQGDNAALEIHDLDGLAAAGYTPHREHRYMYGQAIDQILASEDSSGGATGTVLWGLGDHEGTIRSTSEIFVNPLRLIISLVMT